MMRAALLAVALAALAAVTAGCSSKSSFDKLSRADQEKAFRGDPEKGKIIGQQMMAKYGVKNRQQTGPTAEQLKQNEAIKRAKQQSGSF